MALDPRHPLKVVLYRPGAHAQVPSSSAAAVPGVFAPPAPVSFAHQSSRCAGKYVGSRPIKLRKSNWKNRNIDEVKKRQREKDALLGKKTR